MGFVRSIPTLNDYVWSVNLNIDKRGKVKRHRFFEAVMRSKARMTYTKVAAILIDKDEELVQLINTKQYNSTAWRIYTTLFQVT